MPVRVGDELQPSCRGTRRPPGSRATSCRTRRPLRAPIGKSSLSPTSTRPVVDLVARRRRHPAPRPVGNASTLSTPNVVWTSSRPSPSALAPGSPSTPAGSLIRRPSIWKPPQMPSTARPWAACASMAVSSPRSRSQPRSASVARVPGITTTSAECSARGWSTNATSTCGSRPSASMSVKLLIRGSLTTATRRRSPASGAAAARSPTERESSESSHSSGSHGSTPSTGRCVTASSVSRPGRNSSTVAAELVDDQPADQRLVVLLEQGERAVERGENAAPVDVADEDGGDRGMPGQSHVDEVVPTQVHLGRAARTFAHHDVETTSEVVEGVVRRRGQYRASARRSRGRRDVRPVGPSPRHGCHGRYPA